MSMTTNYPELNRFFSSAARKDTGVRQKPIAEFRPKLERLTNMEAEGIRDFASVYSAWSNKPVVLLVVIRQCHVPMPCRIVGESPADVRVRTQQGWEMNVRKQLILAVEEDVTSTDALVN